MKLNRILAGLCLALCLSGVANAASLLPNGKQTFISANGAPLAGGTVQFYIPGTTSPKDTWQDAAQTILNTNPITLDAAGSATIYGTGVYRQVLKDSAGNLIWDQLTSDTTANGPSWGGTSAGSANAQTVTAPNFTGADGQAIAFVAGLTPTGALTVNPNGMGPINVLNDLATGSVSLSGGEIAAGNVVKLTYSATGGVFHTAVPSSSIPTGIVQAYAGAIAPTGFLMAGGQCVSRTTYSRLFSVIGATYGACDGSTTFALPDMRERVAMGKGDMGGVDAARLTGQFTPRLTLGGVGGEGFHTLTINELPIVTPTGAVAISYPPQNSYSILGGGGTFGGAGTSYNLVQSSSTPANATFTLSMPSFGGGLGHNIIQPSLVLNYIIKT